MLTHRNLVVNATQLIAWFPGLKRAQEKCLCAIPFFHVYGLTVALLGPVSIAATMIIHPNPREIEPVMKVITKTKPAIFPGVPTMYIAIVNHPHVSKYDLKSIRACVSGAAPLPAEVRRKFETITGGKLVEGYGLTEASPVTHCNPIFGDSREGIGMPLPDTDAKLVDVETGTREVGLGESGELAIRGPQVMKGYWNRPEETARVITRDGWLLTGDVAVMDADGRFKIVDRKKDMIIASGYNVYPREVEDVLFEHPAVKQAAVIGIPDAYRGESVKAFVVLKDGATATDAEIVAFCKEKLAPFKVPKKVEFVGPLRRRPLRQEVLPPPLCRGGPGGRRGRRRRRSQPHAVELPPAQVLDGRRGPPGVAAPRDRPGDVRDRERGAPSEGRDRRAVLDPGGQDGERAVAREARVRREAAELGVPP